MLFFMLLDYFLTLLSFHPRLAFFLYKKKNYSRHISDVKHHFHSGRCLNWFYCLFASVLAAVRFELYLKPFIIRRRVKYMTYIVPMSRCTNGVSYFSLDLFCRKRSQDFSHVLMVYLYSFI